MKPLYILKIGGSVATYKNKPGASIRTLLLKKIAVFIKKSIKNGNFNLILIHGAGAFGHQLAHKYGLKNGTGRNEKKWQGALLSRIVNQELDLALAKIFVSAGLRVTPVHTASVIIQNNKKIVSCNIKIIQESLRYGCIPLLYGEMVFDRTLGMSICSGDAIAPYLSKKIKAKKILFASDIEGVFTKDPHIHKDARLIEKINLREIYKNVKLSESHNTDVTGGLLGKIIKLSGIKNTRLESVHIFNGLKAENYSKALLGKKFKHTFIYR